MYGSVEYYYNEFNNQIMESIIGEKASTLESYYTSIVRKINKEKELNTKHEQLANLEIAYNKIVDNLLSLEDL